MATALGHCSLCGGQLPRVACPSPALTPNSHVLSLPISSRHPLSLEPLSALPQGERVVRGHVLAVLAIVLAAGRLASP